MTQFDRGIAVTATGGGVYDAEISDDWRIARGVNGGLLLALVANAISAELGVHGHPDPIAMSAAYLGVPHTGPAQIAVTVMRTGGTYSVVRADLLQQEEGQDPTTRVAVQAVFGDLDALPPQVATSAKRPAFSDYERCLSSSMAPGSMGTSPFLQRVDLRIDPLTVSWALGAPSGVGAIQGWFSMVEPRDPDPLMVLLVVDALPPVTFDLGMPGWAPTLELTVHVRAKPAPGPLRVRHVTRNVAHGMFEEDCEVWDGADRLVAQSRQLALLPRKGGPSA